LEPIRLRPVCDVVDTVGDLHGKRFDSTDRRYRPYMIHRQLLTFSLTLT